MRSLHIQGGRFVIVGLVSNLILYLLYLVLTQFMLGHKAAMSLLYLIGVIQTFFFNKRWTFAHQGKYSTSFVRYVIVYVAGYGVNLSMLVILVDYLGLRHEYIQALALIIVASLTFLAQRYWVFACEQQNTRSMQEGTVLHDR